MREVIVGAGQLERIAGLRLNRLLVEIETLRLKSQLGANKPLLAVTLVDGQLKDASKGVHVRNHAIEASLSNLVLGTASPPAHQVAIEGRVDERQKGGGSCHGRLQHQLHRGLVWLTSVQ